MSAMDLRGRAGDPDPRGDGAAEYSGISVELKSKNQPPDESKKNDLVQSIVCCLAEDVPLDDQHIEALINLLPAPELKRILMALHGRGLVTDDQVVRVFDLEPVLVGA
ncbi:hypothetical protein [Geminicoccus harenae]|uniref:hypothetical protein n=1 Tax=Geminicoccus harenae TaxID=2498453 RepID=UPI00168B4E48|nr:hypothetical protein [Geminicoccus harenae]